MSYQNNWRLEAFLKGLALGVVVMTIAWVLVIERTKKIHKQELDYIMGVMTCSRKDCSNILCDTYVESIGYVCYDCQSEFKEYLENNDLHPTTVGEINKHLSFFMKTSKEAVIDGWNDEMTVNEFFRLRTH